MIWNFYISVESDSDEPISKAKAAELLAIMENEASKRYSLYDSSMERED